MERPRLSIDGQQNRNLRAAVSHILITVKSGKKNNNQPWFNTTKKKSLGISINSFLISLTAKTNNKGFLGVLLLFKHLRKMIHPFYTIIIKRSYAQFIKENSHWLIKKNGKTNHTHKEKYAKCKILKSIMLLRDTT